MTIVRNDSPHPSEIRLQALQLAIELVELRNSTNNTTTTILIIARAFEKYLTEG